MTNTIEIKHSVSISEKMKVGSVVRKQDGTLVYVKSGYYLDPVYGRLSNFWRWQKVNDDGTLSSKEESGYGWC